MSQAIYSARWPEELAVTMKTSKKSRDRDVQEPKPDLGPALEFFDRVQAFPSDQAKEEFDRLVGLDDIKGQVLSLSRLMLDPAGLADWSVRHHGELLPAVRRLSARRPLLIFAGDVGTGKTALAETMGDAIARETQRPATLLGLSLLTRGSGLVGEMTRLLTAALRAVRDWAPRAPGATVLLIDEADALAQSRDLAQMHHEDRAGVNALIQGLDQLRACPQLLIVLCTNRLVAIDPAVQRRATAIYHFPRPNDAQRRLALETTLSGLVLSPNELDELVRLTGPRDGRGYGWTYSDIVDRLVSAAALLAFPGEALSFGHLRRAALTMDATPPFGLVG